MAESATPSPAKAPRYGFIDLLRGFALVVMVETHVMNAYLPLALKKGSEFFFWLAFTNGLVAPTFLFATGFSIVLQGNSQWENWLHFRPSFWRQMRRLGFITLVAYYSHLQGFRWSRYLAEWNDYNFWARSLKVDVLQCIVVSLLVVMALIFILRKKNLLPWAALLLAVAVALVTPWMWAQDFRGKLPLSLALFLNPHGTSLFPIFPWIIFVLVGSSVCCFFLKSVETLPGRPVHAEYRGAWCAADCVRASAAQRTVHASGICQFLHDQSAICDDPDRVRPDLLFPPV